MEEYRSMNSWDTWKGHGPSSFDNVIYWQPLPEPPISTTQGKFMNANIKITIDKNKILTKLGFGDMEAKKVIALSEKVKAFKRLPEVGSSASEALKAFKRLSEVESSASEALKAFKRLSEVGNSASEALKAFGESSKKMKTGDIDNGLRRYRAVFPKAQAKKKPLNFVRFQNDFSNRRKHKNFKG